MAHQNQIKDHTSESFSRNEIECARTLEAEAAPLFFRIRKPNKQVCASRICVKERNEEEGEMGWHWKFISEATRVGISLEKVIEIYSSIVQGLEIRDFLHNDLYIMQHRAQAQLNWKVVSFLWATGNGFNLR